MHDFELEKKLIMLKREMESAEREAQEAAKQATTTRSFEERIRLQSKANQQDFLAKSKAKEIQEYMLRAHCHGDASGDFDLQAPDFSEDEKSHALSGQKQEWTVLNGNFREEWRGRSVQASDPLLRLGAKDGPWEIELKIPQKHIGQVLAAFDREKTSVLDVDFLLRSNPTSTWRGKLHRDRIAGEATPSKDDNNENEPYVLAYVTISGEGIDPDRTLPQGALVSGTEISAKVRCGNHRLGYSLFYGVWEFLYEKVVFFF
jgi:hypothetical protein